MIHYSAWPLATSLLENMIGMEFVWFYRHSFYVSFLVYDFDICFYDNFLWIFFLPLTSIFFTFSISQSLFWILALVMEVVYLRCVWKKMFVAAIVLLFSISLRFPQERPIPDIITRRYGRPTLACFRKVEKNLFKIKNLEQDLKFSNLCKDYEVIPKFIKFKVHNPNFHYTKTQRLAI